MLLKGFENELKEIFISKQPKIIWAEMTKEPSFIWDNKGFYINQTCYFMTNSNPYLLAILNSKMSYFFMKQISSNLGDGAFRWIKQYVERIPIPKITNKNQNLADEIINLVNIILDCNDENERVNLEKQIDELVYQIYDLNAAEIALVENA